VYITKGVHLQSKVSDLTRNSNIPHQILLNYQTYADGAFYYSQRTDSDLGFDVTSTLQAFYLFCASESGKKMDATRKAVIMVALAEYQALTFKKNYYEYTLLKRSHLNLKMFTLLMFFMLIFC